MSLPRAPNPFRNPTRTRHYSRLACQLSGSAIPRGPNRITTTGAPPTSIPRPRANPGPGPAPIPRTKPTQRPFHTTPSLHAARSPRVKNAENVRTRATPVFSNDGLYTGGVANDIPARLKTLEEIGPKLWRTSIIEGFLDENVDRKTFMRIARSLLTSAASRAPSGVVVEEISEDANLVFDIGNIVGNTSPSLMQWIISSTAQAGATIPNLVSAGRALAAFERNGSHDLPTRSSSPVFSVIDTLAQNNDPRALLLQAKHLGLQKRYDEALAHVKSVMAMIHPSKTPSLPSRSMNIGSLEPPWVVYTWLKQLTGSSESEIHEILRTAAIEYQDPEALISYAAYMREQHDDLASYEECIAKAATAGNADACRKLANFYYLTSQGKFPRRGTSSSDPAGDLAREMEMAQGRGKLGAFLSGLFGPQPYREYRGLAIEWYELAVRHGCPKAALALAILMRENGEERELVDRVFQVVVTSKDLGTGLVRSLRVNWDREDYVPSVPEEVLDV